MNLEQLQAEYDKGLKELAKAYVAKENAENNLQSLKQQLGQIENLIRMKESEAKEAEVVEG